MKKFFCTNWLYIVVAVITLVCFAAYMINFGGNEISDDPEKFGFFGDYVGGVMNGLIGVLSVIFVYRAYIAQVNMNRDQKKQLKRERFESSFFEMLSTQREILNQISVIDSDKVEQRGLSAVALIRKNVEEKVNSVLAAPSVLSKENAIQLKNILHDKYNSVFELYASQIGHYFRHLYHIMKYINDEWDNAIDRKPYFDLLQAQMSTDELYLTAINGISLYGRKHLLPLLNDSSFLENLAIDCSEDTVKLIKLFYPNTKVKTFTHDKPNIIFLGGTNEEDKKIISKRLLADFPQMTRVTSAILPFQNGNRQNFSAMTANTRKFKEKFVSNIDSDKLYLFVGNYCEINKNGDRNRVPYYVFEFMKPALLVRVDIVNCMGMDNSLWSEDEYDHSGDVASYLDQDILSLEDERDYDMLYQRVKTIVESF